MNCVIQPVPRQRLSKHISAATNMNATIEERYFLCGPCRDVITRPVGDNNSVMTARVQLKKKSLVLSLKGLDAKTK
jgi:hypothetical protein